MVSSSSISSVKEAKAQFTHLVRKAEAGERIVITRNGKPVADLVPHTEEKPFQGSRIEAMRKWKEANGFTDRKGWVSPDFDDPLPEDFLFQPLPEDFDEKLAVHERGK